MLDHRHGTPMPDELVVANGLPQGAGRGLFESATYTCNHCQAQVVMNPKRTRERGFCRRCHHVICDACVEEMAITLTCVTFEQKVEGLLGG